MDLRGKLVRLAALGAAVLCGATLLVGGATAAQAAGRFIIVNANSSNACLEVSVTGSKRNVVLKKCDKTNPFQQWTVDGTFKNDVSGHCLDGNGADVYTMACNGGDYQKWTTTSGSPKSIGHPKSGKYLHGSGTIGTDAVFRDTIGTASRWVPLAV